MFERILLPLDGSELSEQALPMVQDLAVQLGATIHLLRVVPMENELDAVRSSGSIQLAEMEIEHTRRLNEARGESARVYLEDVRARLMRAGATVSEPATIGQGDPSNVIIAYTKSNDIDLIAMSTHGYGGLKRLLVGSVADKVFRSCEVPVLLNPCR